MVAARRHRERLLAVRKHLEEHGIEEAANSRSTR
jgi:hypothetical protein